MQCSPSRPTEPSGAVPDRPTPECLPAGRVVGTGKENTSASDSSTMREEPRGNRGRDSEPGDPGARAQLRPGQPGVGPGQGEPRCPRLQGHLLLQAPCLQPPRTQSTWLQSSALRPGATPACRGPLQKPRADPSLVPIRTGLRPSRAACVSPVVSRAGSGHGCAQPHHPPAETDHSRPGLYAEAPMEQSRATDSPTGAGWPKATVFSSQPRPTPLAPLPHWPDGINLHIWPHLHAGHPLSQEAHLLRETPWPDSAAVGFLVGPWATTLWLLLWRETGASAQGHLGRDV